MPIFDKSIELKFTTKQVNKGGLEGLALEGSGVVSITTRVSLTVWEPGALALNSTVHARP